MRDAIVARFRCGYLLSTQRQQRDNLVLRCCQLSLTFALWHTQVASHVPFYYFGLVGRYLEGLLTPIWFKLIYVTQVQQQKPINNK